MIPRELIERLGHGIDLLAAIYLLETTDFETGKITVGLRELMREIGIGHTKARRVLEITGTLAEQNRNRTGTPRTATTAGLLATSEQNRNRTGTEPGQSPEKPPHTPLKENYQEQEQEKQTTNARARDLSLFKIWYNVYPRKVAKAQAEKAWTRINPNSVLVELMVQAVAAQVADHETRKARNLFTPEWKHPATWLNGSCWEDVIEPLPLTKAEIESDRFDRIYKQVQGEKNGEPQDAEADPRGTETDIPF